MRVSTWMLAPVCLSLPFRRPAQGMICVGGGVASSDSSLCRRRYTPAVSGIGGASPLSPGSGHRMRL